MRENMRYHADSFLAAPPSVRARGGRGELGAVGALSEPEDVFYLTEPEPRGALLPIASGGGIPASLRYGTRLRQRSESLDFRTSPPSEVLVGDAEAVAADAGARAAARTECPSVGSASPGTGGRLRARRPQRRGAPGSSTGEVIVAAATDPTGPRFLALGGALVLEVGGLLSHGAIVAPKKLGVPP